MFLSHGLLPGPCRLEPSLWQGITPQQYTEWEMEMLLKLGKVSTFLLTPEPVTSTPLTPQERENRIDAIAENFQPRSNTVRRTISHSFFALI